MGRKDQFSYDGFGILFDYLEQVEDATGESIELDVIALCCDYNEDKWLDVAKNYSIDVSHCEDDDEMRETILDYLNDHTSVCGHNDDIVVYACF
jgi:hypothetical protein